MNILRIGNQIRERRNILRLDQVSAADLAGVSVHALSDLESGKGNPTLETLQKLTEALGLEIRMVLRIPEAPDA